MGTTPKIILQSEPIHPGEDLAEMLRDLEMSATALAHKMNVPANRVTTIIRGRRDITADTAFRLGRVFNMSAEYWLNLQ